MVEGSVPRAELEAALAPLLARVGGRVVDDPREGDIPVPWAGGVALHVRLQQPGAETTDLSDGLARLIAAVESELGAPLESLSRADKQHAVRLLEERGAFEMRRSAETVAEALGLTRFTVYNYLNRIRDSGAADQR
jgi:DNA binding protein with HTH domain